MLKTPEIAVIGLGYVGLPLAVGLSKHFPVTGFDINVKRITELQDGFDRTNEVANSTLRSSALRFTSDLQDLHKKDIYIVTVPTPVTEDNLPDLSPLQKASEMIGKILKKGAIVVFESTVYPGVTEEFCGPILEKASGLIAGQDFYLGYSPERINPGDKQHTVESITKIVAGQTPEIAEQLKYVYGTVNHNNIFVASNIKTAEAAKVIENAQRDINIAFINEIALIMQKLDLSVYEVLEAAGTKWNFLRFQPGLVGGHCIGVDPYYLAHCARQLGHEPEAILAGRRINEAMGPLIAEMIHKKLSHHDKSKKQPLRILILGLTFKENIPDLRNTKVVDLISSLSKAGYEIDIHDPHANPEEAKKYYNLDLQTNLESLADYHCVIGAVPHQGYKEFSTETFQKLLQPKGLIADLKNIWAPMKSNPHFHYWSL